jgi:signal transduction histidine kinase
MLIAPSYLENILTPVFTPGRAARLSSFASETTISLANARLFRDLQERVSQFRWNEVTPNEWNEADEKALKEMKRGLQRNHIVLHQQFEGKRPAIIGGNVQLAQVVVDPIRNASDGMNDVDYLPRRLLVKTERSEDNHVRASVANSCVRLGEESVGKLFETFYTATSSGMGVGLSVTRLIVESHGGSLWAEPNEGPEAKVIISIPFESGDPMLVDNCAGVGPNLGEKVIRSTN